MRTFPVFCLLALTLAFSAKADIVVNADSGPVPDGANFRWTYTASLENHTLVPGDYFAIIDFIGYVTGSGTNPADWTLVEESETVNASLIFPDDPSTLNLRWVYSGSTLNPPQTFSPFSALTTVGGSGQVVYIAQTEGGQANNVGPTVIGPAPASGIPEPSSLSLFGAGFGGLAFLLYRRK